MTEITYTIGEICEKLGCEQHNLRYLEKALELEIERDQFGNRLYTEQDLTNLEMVMSLKQEGLNFNAIKKILNRQEQVAETAVEETRNDLTIQNQNLEAFIKMLTIEITKNVEEVVNTKVEALTNELHDIKKSNMEMQEQLLHHQQEHFRNVDDKLNKWREENNKGFFSKLFKK